MKIKNSVQSINSHYYIHSLCAFLLRSTQYILWMEMTSFILKYMYEEMHFLRDGHIVPWISIDVISTLDSTMFYRWLYTYSPIFCIEFVSKLSRQSVSPSTDHKLNWWSVDGETDCRDSLLTNSIQTSWSVDGEKLDPNFMVGRRWNWLSWQFTNKESKCKVTYKPS